MAAFLNVFFDPVAQANLGLYPSASTNPKFSSIGLVSFGFLWGNIWEDCAAQTGVTYSPCGYTTAITYSACGFTTAITWGEC